MDVIELIPSLHFLRFPVGHAYLCEDPDGLALIDTSVPGSAPQIAAAIRTLGHDPADLRWLLLALGVPSPPCLGRRAHGRWSRPGRPWRRYALLRRERPEDVRVDDGVPGGGGSRIGVRLLGAE